MKTLITILIIAVLFYSYSKIAKKKNVFDEESEKRLKSKRFEREKNRATDIDWNY